MTQIKCRTKYFKLVIPSTLTYLTLLFLLLIGIDSYGQHEKKIWELDQEANVAHYDSAQYEKAYELRWQMLQRALDLKEGSYKRMSYESTAYGSMALAQRALGNFKNADSLFQKAIEAYPSDRNFSSGTIEEIVKMRLLYAELLRDMGAYDRALEVTRENFKYYKISEDSVINTIFEIIPGNRIEYVPYYEFKHWCNYYNKELCNEDIGYLIWGFKTDEKKWKKYVRYNSEIPSSLFRMLAEILIDKEDFAEAAKRIYVQEIIVENITRAYDEPNPFKKFDALCFTYSFDYDSLSNSVQQIIDSGYYSAGARAELIALKLKYTDKLYDSLSKMASYPSLSYDIFKMDFSLCQLDGIVAFLGQYLGSSEYSFLNQLIRAIEFTFKEDALTNKFSEQFEYYSKKYEVPLSKANKDLRAGMKFLNAKELRKLYYDGYSSEIDPKITLQRSISEYKDGLNLFGSFYYENSQYLSLREKKNLFERYKLRYNEFLDLSIDYLLSYQGKDDSLFIEDLKAFILKMQASMKGKGLEDVQILKKSVDASNDQMTKNLYNELIVCRRRLIAAIKDTDEESNSRIIELESEINMLELNLSKRVGLKLNSSQYSTDILMSQIDSNEIIIDLMRVARHPRTTIIESGYVAYLALIISKKGIELKVNSNGEMLESKAFINYNRSIFYKQKDRDSYKNYYFWFLEDYLGQINISSISMINDGIYNLLNPNAVLVSDTAYLGDLTEISLISSLRYFYNQTKNQVLSKDDIILFGRPSYELHYKELKTDNQRSALDFFGGYISDLPGTEKEVLAIDQMYKGQTRVYLKENATEANLSGVDNPGILHIATHGFFLSNSTSKKKLSETEVMMNSGLILAMNPNSNSASDDGILTANEASLLNLSSTSLVVLSACETGLGNVENGEGVFGLQRGFLSAGADHLIMSMWSVSDMVTVGFMQAFYSELKKSKDIEYSYNTAIAFIRQQHSDPFDWAPFVLLKGEY